MENINIGRLSERLKEHNIDAALITSKQNIMYFSGFTSEDASLLITKDSRFIITDFRYIEQCKIQCPSFTIVDLAAGKLPELLRNLCGECGIKTMWFEPDDLSYNDYSSISESIKPAKLVPDNGIPSELRIIKSEEEIDNIAKAAALADKCFEHILSIAREGMTERDIAIEIEFFIKRNGSEGLSFDSIAASGPNGAMPHAGVSDRVIRKGDFLTLDFGCRMNGYCSDMTRTIAFGKPDDKLMEIYRITLDAQLKALEIIKPGLPCRDADIAARSYISEKGYGEYFGHSLGHGVGLNIHEEPRLSTKSDSILTPGMVVTVEPGIYLPDVGGVRIEDLIVITENGFRNLTSSRKDLVIIN